MRCLAGLTFAALCLGGCGSIIPKLEEDGIAISEIVERVKCELAFAVPDLRGNYPSGNYQWIKYWTAKVELTLDVNDQASIKPNSSVVEPMTQVVLPGVGTFSRMFSVGFGGELTEQAIRTEKLSFTLSVKELTESRDRARCVLPQNMGLMGNLGLGEWI